MTDPPFSRAGEIHRLTVRVTPKASRDAIAGLVVTADGRSALSVRLTAPPVDNAANKALISYLAKALGVPRSGLRIASGETSRLKIVEVSGATDETLAGLIS